MVAEDTSAAGNVLAALMAALTGEAGFALVERHGELFIEPVSA